ncbi:unnamed protein product, partial [Oikopleura dioica]
YRSGSFLAEASNKTPHSGESAFPKINPKGQIPALSCNKTNSKIQREFEKGCFSLIFINK